MILNENQKLIKSKCLFLNESEVVWRFKNRPINNQNIIDVEHHFKIKLPQDFIQCVLRHNGSSPITNIFDMPSEKGKVFNYLSSLSKKDEGNIFEVNDWIKDRMPNKIIAFADDPFGNYICFDYRHSNTNPKIVYWDHEISYHNKEKSIDFICETFTELLNKLYK